MTRRVHESEHRCPLKWLLMSGLGQQCVRRTFPHVTTLLTHRNSHFTILRAYKRVGGSEEIKFDQRMFWDFGDFWVESELNCLIARFHYCFQSYMWLDPNIQRNSLVQAGHRWTSQRCKRYCMVYIHPQESHLWMCLGNKQINQCQLELWSK